MPREGKYSSYLTTRKPTELIRDRQYFIFPDLLTRSDLHENLVALNHASINQLHAVCVCGIYVYLSTDGQSMQMSTVLND